jgi:hypothetical protein
MGAVIPVAICVTLCVSLIVLPFFVYLQAPKTIFEKALRHPAGKRLLIYFVAAWEAWICALMLLLAGTIFWPSDNDVPLPLQCLMIALACVGVVGILWTEYKRQQLQKLG